MSWRSVRKEVLQAYAGGLVHDLGKVWAQVPGRGAGPSRFGCESPERHAVRFADCPTCTRAYRYAHAPMGANLVAEALPEFGFLAEIVARHHTPDPGTLGNVLRWVVLGDHLSAGERDERYDTEAEPVPALLHPLAPKRRWVAPGLLNAGLFFDTLDEGALAEAARERYTNVLEGLQEALVEAGRRAGGDLFALCEHLTGAIYSATMAVPSAFQSTVADIPLATHLHLAGAFAAALAAGNSPATRWEEAQVGLIAGDLSGIQEFIHDTGSRRAARSLRARSFYVQLLALVAARWVAVQSGVPPWNAFSIVGGQFLVAVPAGAVDRLGALQQEIDRVLWEAHGPTLGIGLGGAVVTGEQLARFGEVLEGLREQLSARKRQRCLGLAREGSLFAPQQVTPAGRACRTCGREPGEGRVIEDDGEEIRLCSMCDSLEELGRELLDRGLLEFREWPGGSPGYGWQAVMGRLGHAIRLRSLDDKVADAGALVALDERALRHVPCARYVPTARHVPREQGQLLDFAELARRGPGRPAIATLKADVDDLGEFLRKYFTERSSSPSRFLAVSLAISLFFEGYLPQLAEQDYPNIYLIFSGGDDVALAGPLQDVIHFGLRLREEFSRWTAANPALHFSAGIAAAHAHRPVQAGIEEAEGFLSDAKRYQSEGSKKNATTVLRVRMPWDRFESVVTWAKQLVELTGSTPEKRRLARGALQRLQMLEGADPGTYGPLHWRSYYQLNRVAGDHPEAGPLLMDLRQQAFRGDGAGGRAVALAARLAELSTAPGNRESQDERG